ncbi:hypothetical protein ES288_A06G071800v1 [Gossypium darwinii]|uniref:Uncharacterized protein n=1 Tax=Gossypium darwinii TaxID=34276 RepID=A0A5D2G4W7_GOSDA|nr:hypothetical protein ES288_A06G071800v1 [Gossypium darwinii]TYH12497.1 hypothetical protein ES288_A06G071800v1 [Gossypium darwinii]
MGNFRLFDSLIFVCISHSTFDVNLGKAGSQPMDLLFNQVSNNIWKYTTIIEWRLMQGIHQFKGITSHPKH